MKVHLKYTHREQLAKHLPLRGKGFNMDYRAAFVIDFLKRMKPQEFYDHRTAEFVSLDEPEIQKARPDPNKDENLDSYLN